MPPKTKGRLLTSTFWTIVDAMATSATTKTRTEPENITVDQLTFLSTRNLAIANRSRVSCAHKKQQ